MQSARDNDLFFEIKKEFREKTQSGRNWQTRFLSAFNGCSAERLACFLETSPKDQRVKRAIKSGGRAGLRPDQQRRFIGLQR